jgi:transketolase
MSIASSHDSLTAKALSARKNILRILHAAQASHLGSSMSIVEMLVAMYSLADISKILDKSEGRDRIIVSKGHAAAATYSVMHEFELMTEETLFTYHQLNSKLQGHVSHGVNYVEHSTGALGQKVCHRESWFYVVMEKSRRDQSGRH